MSHQRITRGPPYSSTAIRTLAFSSAKPSAFSRVSGGAPSAGISTSSGTTARSWNSSTPITRLPCSLSSSRRSAISLTTIAVLLIVSAPESTSAACQPQPPGRPAARSETSKRAAGGDRDGQHHLQQPEAEHVRGASPAAWAG